ncbi:MAG TPA: hypothetical protein VFW14_20275 [Gaiellales bacterium]|nr:hypothetical protein [Gaiellales bacterium]
MVAVAAPVTPVEGVFVISLPLVSAASMIARELCGFVPSFLPMNRMPATSTNWSVSGMPWDWVIQPPPVGAAPED